MNLEQKEKAYRSLIQQVKEFYLIHYDNTDDARVRLKWCDDCEEINLWTYWQGRGHLNAQVLLVGQDWGCPWDDAAKAVMENIRAMNRGEDANYMDHNESITDTNLVRLFQEVGYNILSDDIKNQELFFTNLVLGYRNHRSSKNFRKKWVRNDAGFFWELVNIIEPEKILCLGRSTFEGVLLAFNKQQLPLKIKSYNAFITSLQNPVICPLNNGRPTRIYALAHCGAMGTLNRNGGNKIINGNVLDTQLQDWRKIF